MRSARGRGAGAGSPARPPRRNAWLGLLAAGLLLAPLAAAADRGARPTRGAAPQTAPVPAAPAAPAGEATVYTVTIDDAIHPISAGYFEDAIARADRDGAALLILRLDTPGGLFDSMERMITAMTHARVPVVVFVHGSKAASAGFFLTIAADVAVMAPGTRIGAAHPVLALGELPKDSPMFAKIENDAAAYVRSLATRRGRNAVEAEKAVRDSRAFTEEEALKLGLIDFIASDEAQIVSRLDGRPVRRFTGGVETLHLARTRMVSIDRTASDRFLSALANPVLATILLLLGVLGLYVEFTHPGLIAPGIVGAVALLLFLMSTWVLPVSWVGVGFVALGLVLFALEIKTGSHGALAAAGIACLVLGAFLLFRGAGEMPGFAAARGFLLAFAAAAGFVMAALAMLVGRVARRRPATGSDGLVSERGTALTDLDPAGRVFVHGEYWNAHARRPVRKGARVVVTGVRDLELEVDEVP